MKESALYVWCQGGILPPSTIPDMPNIHSILGIIGLCFGHQPGLDQSSGRISSFLPRGIAFRVNFDFSKVGKHNNY